MKHSCQSGKASKNWLENDLSLFEQKMGDSKVGKDQSKDASNDCAGEYALGEVTNQVLT